jgi:MobA-like NTP transferase domain
MLGVIPAAGQASRFGGVMKELLPIADGSCLLDSAVRRAQLLGADEIVVVSRVWKLAAHAGHLSRTVKHVQVSYTVQDDDSELWGAIRTTLSRRQDSILVMPDTTFRHSEGIPADCDLAFGTFMTEEPQRFSVLYEGRIRTKMPPTRPGRQHWIAWGCVFWSQAVVEGWLRREQMRGVYKHYDEAFQEALSAFGCQQFALEDYNDLGSLAHYKEYMGRDK